MKTPGWLQSLLEDPGITDICINGGQSVRIDSHEGMRLIPLPIPGDSDWSRDWAVHQLAAAGKTWDARHPYADAAILPAHRMHVIFPPVSQSGVLISLRRIAYARAGGSKALWAEEPAYDLLAEAVRKHETVIVCGATGSGKTTLATDLLGLASPEERIIALEDTPELRPSHPQFMSLVCRPPNADGFGEVTLRDLLKQTLRMRPDRIVLGECRGNEVLDLLQCLNTGHRGALATLHANGPRDALRRIELLCLLAAGGAIPPRLIRELLANGVKWIAHVEREGQRRRIAEICSVEGLEGDIILLRPMLKGIHVGELIHAS